MAFPEYFAAPGPVGNGPQWVVYEAADQAQATKYEGYGYKGPYATKAAAQNYANQKIKQISSTEFNPQLPDPLTGIDAIGHFFSILSQGNTWVRIGKIVFGGVLLIIGIAHMTGADNAVASVARKVPLPV